MTGQARGEGGKDGRSLRQAVTRLFVPSLLFAGSSSRGCEDRHHNPVRQRASRNRASCGTLPVARGRSAAHSGAEDRTGGIWKFRRRSDAQDIVGARCSRGAGRVHRELYFLPVFPEYGFICIKSAAFGEPRVQGRSSAARGTDSIAAGAWIASIARAVTDARENSGGMRQCIQPGVITATSACFPPLHGLNKRRAV